MASLTAGPSSAAAVEARPLIVHVVYQFAVGGLENGVVSLINHLPAQRWRHAVLSLTDVDPGFAARVVRRDVRLVALHKSPGHALALYPALWRAFRALRPAIVHTRNLAALEVQPAATWAGVPVRIHGEHGRDASDPHGTVRRYQWLRRAYAPFVHHHVALSRDLAAYLRGPVGLPERKVTVICNGVDSQRFVPRTGTAREALAGCPFSGEHLCLVGTVGRMLTVKAQPLLARAFVQALREQPALRASMRLVLVGDGPLRAECEAVLAEAGMSELAWLAGERSDIPALMRGLDLFVLPSLAEGISNTILEAMACGVPVVATAVGGNAELVVDGSTGQIVPAGDVPALAAALAAWAGDPDRRRAAGAAGRAAVEDRFSLHGMVDAYDRLYRGLLGQRVPEVMASSAGERGR